MPPVWTRHPRYAIFVLAILAVTYYLLGPFESHHHEPAFTNFQFAFDKGLPGRLQMADQIYDQFLDERQALIKKHGPTPEDLVNFPPNKAPWPPYTVWDFFVPMYNCPHEIRRIGALGDGGKWVCGLSRVQEKPDCIIYSVGINYESSFEAGLLANTRHCEVWGYDFSVKSFGPEIPADQRHRAHFFQYGMSGSDRYTDDGLYPLYTLETLMKLNGHTHIDILKVDIESWEFETLTTLVKSFVDAGKPLPFGQLQLEVHIWHRKFAEFLKWWESLEAAGLRPFWTEPNLVYQNYNGEAALAEYSFINIKGNNIFIKDPVIPPAAPGSGQRGYTHAPDRN